MDKIKGFLESDKVRGLALSSQRTYGYALGHLETYLKRSGISIGRDLEEHCPGFILYLKQRGVTGRTIQYYCRVVRIMMSHHGIPVPGFTYRLTNQESHNAKEKRAARWLTEDEVGLCLTHTFPRNHERNHLIIRLLAETGCRVAEIAEIRRDHVDTDNQTLYIGKSKTTARTVFMSPETSRLMSEYLVFSRINRMPPARVFPIKAQTIKKLVGEMFEALGIKRPGRLTHVFRHYVATYLFYRGGVDLNDIAFLLGDTPETIRKIYIHPTSDMLGDRVRKGFGW